MKKQLVSKIIILILIILAVFVIYIPHINNPGEERIIKEHMEEVKNPGFYPYPLHADEWAHIGISQYVMNTGRFPNVNPYTDTERVNPQSGFHFLNATIFEISGLDIVWFYQFLAPLLAVLTSLFIYSFITDYSGQKLAGFFSSVFFLSIQSNINILGNLFFLPHTFSFFLLISFLYYYHKNNHTLTTLSFLVSLITYPMISILLATILFFKEGKKLRNNYWALSTLAFLAITALSLYQFNLSTIINTLIFRHGWTLGYEYSYGLTELVPFTLYLFAILGLYILFKQKKYFLFLPLLPVFSLITYSTMDFSIFIPYQRALMYLFVGLSLPAGIGAYKTLDWLRSKSCKKIIRVENTKFNLNQAIPFIIGVTIILVSFQGYYEVENPSFTIIKWASEDSVETFRYVKEIHGENQKMILDYTSHFYAPVLTKGTVLAVPPSNLQDGDMNDINLFFRESCDYKNRFIEEKNVDLIVTRQNIDCGYERERINNHNIYTELK